MILETSGVATVLPPRRLPDVADLVSGVVYARAAEAEAMPARGRYELKIAGAAESGVWGEGGHQIVSLGFGHLADQEGMSN